MTEKPTRIYQCENTVDGILSAVYDAGLSGYGHKYIRIQPVTTGEAIELSLFSEYVPVESDSVKSARVVEAVRNKICRQAYSFVMAAVLSCFPDRGDTIYQFVTYGFTMGARVCSAMQLPCVQRIFEIKRTVYNEAHFFKEFLRFQEVRREPPLLFAIFEPKHQVVTIVTEHFADRFREEWFIIYDKTHKEASFHQPGTDWEIRLLEPEEALRLEELAKQKEAYAGLWKTFFENIAIAERKNPALQRNLMPLHYRKHMTEFLSTSSSD